MVTIGVEVQIVSGSWGTASDPRGNLATEARDPTGGSSRG